MSRPITTPDVPVIVAASILTTYDSPMLPIVKVGTSPTLERNGVKFFQAIGSLPIITLLTETSPGEYYKVLWNPCTTTSIWIGSLEFQDSLEDLLRIFEVSGFGDAKVDSPPLPPALLTLNQVVSLYRSKKLRCGLRAKEIASRTVLSDPEMSLTEAMGLMCQKRIRRLFLRGRKGEFVSDRGILAFLFSPMGLKVARDTPESWMDIKLGAIRSMSAHAVEADALVEDVGKLVEHGRDVFVLSDGEQIISKWDLVMKPWRQGELRLASTRMPALN
jgi:predicted transcriptional regulator